MAHIATITIHYGNNQSLPFSPADYKLSYDSLAGPDSGRSDSGKMHINWIRTKYTKLEITLPPHQINDPIYSRILALVQGQEYSLTYFDYLEGINRTKTFYTSNSSASFYSGVVLNGIVQDVTFSAIEKEGETSTPHHS